MTIQDSPQRELIVWENAELRASLFRGLADVAEGHTSRLNLEELDVDDE